LLGVLGRYERCGGDGEAEREAAGANPFSQIPELTDAERAVADALPIGADPDEAARVLGRVPLWFHTFALNAAHGLYTPGVARDRYRMPIVPASFAGQRALDVGTFDGFYAFLAEDRGAARVVAVDNEQYVAWVKGTLGDRARRRRCSNAPTCPART
jgi:predicted nicotinamide N-methyase